jgi:hypothetical protein
MIVLLPKLPAVCGSCGHRVPYERIAERCYRVLLDAYYHQRSADELRMLYKVAEYYRRNPRSEILKARDLELRDKLRRSVPLAEIKALPAPDPFVESDYSEDASKYLEHHIFKLEPRLRFVTEQFERTRYATDQVPCPKCGTGRMRLRSKDRDASPAG